MAKGDKLREIDEVLEGFWTIAEAYFVAIETGMNVEGKPITIEELETLSKNMGTELEWMKHFIQD